MPALHVFGTRWEASTDSFALYALLLLVYHVIWLFMYWIGLVAFTAPSKCPYGPADPQQYVFTYLLLFFYILWPILAAAMLLVSLKGSPLEVSKRRWLIPLIYTYSLSLLLGLGALAYAVYVLYGVDDTCWASGSKAMMKLMTFGAMGILAGIAFTLITTHLLFGEVRPGVKWHALKKGVTTCVGVYGWLLLRDRGPLLNLEEMATEYLDQHGNTLDLDKTDVVVALLCARLVQQERREAQAQKLLEAAGYSMHPGAPRGGHPSARTPPSPGPGPGGVPGEAAEESPAATAKAQQGTMSGRADSCQPPPSADVLATDNGGTDRHTVAEWVRRVCQGRGAALTPCTAAVQHLAQRVGVAQAAALCTVTEGAVDEAALGEARRWACYAAAAYGTQGYLWTVQGGLAARWRLAKLARQAQRGGSLPGGSSGNLAAEFVAIREVVGVAGEDIVHVCAGDVGEGRLAYFIALDRQQRAVVLSVSGQQPHYALMAPTPTQLPTEWTPQELKGLGPHAVHAGALEAAQKLLVDLESHGTLNTLLPAPASSGTAAITTATTAPGQQQMGVSQSTQGAGAAAQAERGAGTVGTAVDVGVGTTAGWSLVLTGHGQGAGAAVLLGLRLQQQYPGLQVWAFGPPGGLCSPALSRHLRPTTRCLMLGRDAVPRASSTTVAALVEEGLAGLARLRYNKGLAMVALLAEKAGPRSWRGKWLNPERALHKPENIPTEVMQQLARYLEAAHVRTTSKHITQSKGLPHQGHTQQLPDWAEEALGDPPANAPPSSPAQCMAEGPGTREPLGCLTQLAGQVIYLRRMRTAPHPHGIAQQAKQQGAKVRDVEAGKEQAMECEAGHEGQACKQAGCCGGCCGDCIPLCASLCGARSKSESLKVWDAAWVSPEAVRAEGIIVSKRSMTDHYVSRLLSVLQRVQI